MKRIHLLNTLLVLFGMLLSGSGFSQDQHSAVAQQVLSAKQNRTVFQQVDLFTPSTERAEVTFDKVLANGTILDLDVSATRTTTQDLPDAIRLEIPTGQRERLELELVRVEILTDDFTLLTSESDERPIDYTPGAYYRGIVAGDPYSIAAISIFDGEVSGIIGDNVFGNRILGKIQDDARGEQHILYSEHDLLVLPEFECGTEDTPLSAEDMDLMRQIASGDYVDNRDANNCVRVYLELEHDLVTEKGGAAGATNFITAVWNMVATLYQNESVNTQVSQIFTWTTPDSYPTSGTSNALNAFRTARPNYNGDLAHLISRGQPSGGGVAWVNALCSSYGYAYSWINSSYAQIPTYSWTVNVLTHEMGHNLGSSHTHACIWNGNNTPIDGCAPTYNPQYSEGCVGPVPNKGTIMSYCHLLSNVGIDLNLGFGPQPGALIRNRVYNANCLTACSGGGACHSVSINKNDVSCNGGNDGSATATPQGGTGPFTYAWSNGATTSTINNLSAGSYSVTVSDGGNCNIVSSVTVAQPSAITLSLQPTPAAGGNNGAVNLTVGGGTAPYTYSWNNGSTSQDINNLAPGTYSVTVTDNNGCTNSGSVQVTDATQGCNGTSVRLTINFDNYPGDVSWNLKNDAGTTVASGGNYTTAGGTYTEIFCLTDGCYDFEILDGYGDGLCTQYSNGNTLGDYTLTNLNDNSSLAGGCDYGAGETTNFCLGNQNPPLAATATATDLDCNGDSDATATANATGGTGSYSYAWSNGDFTKTINGLNAGTYTVTVTSGAETVTASVVISQPSALNLTTQGGTATNGSNGNVSASASGGTPGYSYSWSTGALGPNVGGLAPGTYGVTVTDFSGCTATGSATVSDNTPNLSVSATGSALDCFNDKVGTATATATGGNGTYAYLWSNGATSATISGLSAGTYGVTVTSGGQTATASTTVSQPSQITLSASATPANNGNNGTATASTTGGTPGYSYNWSNNATGATITGLAPGSYSVTVTDANGCSRVNNTTVADNNGGGGFTPIKYEFGQVDGIGDDVWHRVYLNNTYTRMVIVATVVNNNQYGEPVVTRVRPGLDRFLLKVQVPGGSTDHSYTIHYTVVEQGTYTVAEHGVAMEARRTPSKRTQGKNNWASSNLDKRGYVGTYTNPTIVGQVMSANNDEWSVFFSSSRSNVADPYDDFRFAGFKQVGEDPQTARVDEVVGYIVVESGTGTMPDGTAYTAAVGADIVAGMDNNTTGYNYDLGGFNTQAAVLSSAGMDGGDGGWPVFRANPAGNNNLVMAIDEDQLGDTERAHTTEQVAYLAFGSQTGSAPATGSMPTTDAAPVFDAETFSDLNVYPNPARDVLTVEFDFTGSETVQFMVTDMMGRQVGPMRKNDSLDATGQFQIDVTEYQAGTYLLHAIGTEGRQSKKFSVIR